VSDAAGNAITIDPALLQAPHRGTLTDLLGVRFVEGSLDRVVAEIEVRDDLRTVGGRIHGGTLMTLADIVGATAAAINLPPGASTTTLESKTNFFAAGREGRIRAEATPLHRGRRTQVWQTRVTDDSGRLLSLTIQTQMVLTD
jgi:1,4-dihydroxy-2-naphthoyl-CoA hydrolase